MKLPDVREKWNLTVVSVEQKWNWFVFNGPAVLLSLNFMSFGMNFIHATIGGKPGNFYGAAFSLGITFFLVRGVQRDARKDRA